MLYRERELQRIFVIPLNISNGSVPSMVYLISSCCGHNTLLSGCREMFCLHYGSYFLKLDLLSRLKLNRTFEASDQKSLHAQCPSGTFKFPV